MVLKGGLALEDKLRVTAPDFLRYTHDIDLHVGSIETYTEVFGDIESWLNSGTEQMRIGIDLNVAPMHIISIDYTDTFNIPTYDIYAILHLADISYAQLWQRPGVVSQRNYMLLPEHYDSLQHAFTQFKGIEQHHDFDSIISVVSYFMTKYMKEWGVTGGTYAAECALGMQGFGSYPYAEFPIFLSNAEKRVDLRPISLHPKITEPTPDEYGVRDVLEKEIEYALNVEE